MIDVCRKCLPTALGVDWRHVKTLFQTWTNKQSEWKSQVTQTPFITRWCFAYTVLDILSRREWSAAARIWINLSLASVEQLLGWLLSLFCSAKSGGTGIARSVFYCSPIMLNRQMSCIFHNKIRVIWEMALLGVHSGNNCAAVQDRKRTPNGVNVTPVYSK